MTSVSLSMRREESRKAKRFVPVVELDRWQLTGLVGLMLILTLGAFVVGLEIGKKQPTHAQERPALVVAAPGATNAMQRHIALAEVWPPTQAIDRDLSRPLTPPLPADPTERARAEAHQQLLESRAAGLRNDATPPAPVGDVQAPPMVVPDQAQQGFTLQVSLFDSQGAANAVGGQLLDAGHPVRIRQVMSADGRSLYRVEIGQFESAPAATAFQRRFERDSGYSAVLVPL